MRSIIRIENVSKRYRLGRREQYTMLRDRIVEGLKTPLRRTASMFSREGQAYAGEPEIWALRNVSLAVEPGEVVGIIGRNGAGKSTLLKILSRITEPTKGRVELYGRVGSLLEVGTGFHGELTGRENIFLSGAILGMQRKEIARKFDEIVAFAEVEQFIDTPVKHFSSGMYTRLAFAVAAHLEPEILLVDEVLAVGDLAFQKKCLGKMGDVAHNGRTVFFVSHNLPSIEALCSRCLLFRSGNLEADGSVNELVAHYMMTELKTEGSSRPLKVHGGRSRGSTPIMTEVRLSNGTGGSGGVLRMGSGLEVALDFCADKAFAPVLGVTIKNMHGLSILRASNHFIGGFDFARRQSRGTISCTFGTLPLLPGRYCIDLALGDGFREFDTVLDAITFQVLPSDVFGTGKLPPAGSAVVFWPANFALECDGEAKAHRGEEREDADFGQHKVDSAQ